ncbi:MAG TPA: YidB family protein [Candidatus Acidoferrum sp.]|nr:YidB family protein [Candidatus Acidoferrum sp.]
MGLLDDVLGMAGMGNVAQSQQHAGALTMILNYINSPEVGGIAGLQKMFQEKGLGSIIGSWIGTGQNLPISADQLKNVLEGGALQSMAAKSGMDMSQLTGIFSQLMPHAVDQMTPNGQIPDANALDQMMKGLAASPSS